MTTASGSAGSAGSAVRLVSRISSSSGRSRASATRPSWGEGSTAVTRPPAVPAQSTSTRVRSPANAPTSTIDRTPAASRQGRISSADCAIDVPQRSGSEEYGSNGTSGLDGDRGELGRERRSAEEPVLDREPRVGHRGIRARLVQEQLVEEQRVARLEDRPDDRNVAGGVLGLGLRHLVGE